MNMYTIIIKISKRKKNIKTSFKEELLLIMLQ